MSLKNFFIEETKTENYYGKSTVRTVRIGRVIACGVALLLVLILLCTMIRFVPTGYTGILTTFGKVEDTTLDAGLNIIAPWQRIVKLDNRSQKVEIQTDAFSSDIQQVQVVASINYCIDQQTAHTLYKTVGKNYYDNVVLPRILENVKAVFAKYSAENLIANREDLSTEIVAAMRTDMADYGINVISLSIEDIDFTDAFTDAVEAKQVAAQEKLTAETKQAQLTMEQRAEAERAVIAAEAELEVTKIQAESAFYAGEKEAEMNKKIADSLSEGLIKYYYIKQWDGKLPTTVLGDGQSVIFNMEP